LYDSSLLSASFRLSWVNWLLVGWLVVMCVSHQASLMACLKEPGSDS
jgi:hypothetical protein